jgi:signal transduction histidine kinase
MQPLPGDAAVYLERAGEGLRRLDTVLTRMSEATRLEHAVRQGERERFDAREVVRGCASGYATAYPQRRFDVVLPDGPALLRGAPDLYAQMLDKLVANAADFSSAEAPVRIVLEVRDGRASLAVSNRGARLPKAMAGKLFESMVSVRGESRGSEPHLGLGLYIVRLVAEFHGGKAEARDLEDGSGVVVKVTCPLASP